MGFRKTLLIKISSRLECFPSTYSTLLQASSNPPQCSQKFHLYPSLDSITYTKLIQSSTKDGSLISGKLAHAHMIKTSFKPSLFLLNNLLNMYCKCGEMGHAQNVFDNMSIRDIISWNSIISGYTQMGLYDMAMNLFGEARVDSLKLDKFTYASALCVCARIGDLKLGRMIHGLIMVNGLRDQVYLNNSLINMYSTCGRVDQARLLFENSNELDAVSWNSLIAGYVRSGENEEMLRLLVKMHQSGKNFNSYVLGSVLKACCSNFSHSLECGKVLHGYTVKLGSDLDIVVGTALLDMYAKIGDLNEAIQIFRLMPIKNVIMYNAMISGFYRPENSSDEFADEAVHLFSEMRRQGMKPSKFTFSSILKACNVVEAFEYGKQIHALICKNNIQSDEFIGSALVDLYTLSGSVEDGAKCFHRAPKVDIVLWTSMISAYVQSGKFECASALFNEMLASGRKPDQFTISSMMSGCANLSAARSGEQIQGYATKTGYMNYTIVRNTQICLYANSGDIDSASLTFEEAKNHDVVSWSVMIHSNAKHGCAREALNLFQLMKGCGIAPNHITFLGVLTACSHGGLVEEGLGYYRSMMEDYSITPNVKHFACVVDLLGRAGRLVDAETFIMSSGFEDDPIIWRALLSACSVHKDTVTGQRVAERVIELEPQAAASYVLLYNIYTDCGQKMPATKVRDLMKDRGIKKKPGLSWIEVGNKVHSFVVGDKSHPMSVIIYARLEEMLKKIEKMGYSDEKHVPYATELKHKDCSVFNYHSEKLAVTFGMISLTKSAPIRVMKNLRTCRDCHTTMKLFSKAENREIILRDPIRFHRFREGSCSCQDYW